VFRVVSTCAWHLAVTGSKCRNRNTRPWCSLRDKVVSWPSSRLSPRASPSLLPSVATLLTAQPIRAADEPGVDARQSTITNVIELFTSQGCDSCPPADALLKTYADRKDVLALSFHVDYWDYLGWKDTLASAKFTERQRNYAKARNDGQVYTPQAVINGLSHVNGASARDVETALADTQSQVTPNRVPLRFWTDRGSIMIETGGADPAASAKDATVWLAVVQKSADVVIDRGENRGKTIHYVNIVRANP
jgi:hypothetical protein